VPPALSSEPARSPLGQTPGRTASREPSLLRRSVTPLIRLRTWRESLHLLLDLPLGVAWFTIAVTMISLSVGLLITLIGIPLLVGTVAIGRAIGRIEIQRARWLLDSTLVDVGAPDTSGTLGQRVKRGLGDGAGWKGLLYGVLMLPWGIFTFTATVTLWSVAVTLATSPLYGWLLPVDFGTDTELVGWAKAGFVAGCGVVGVALVIASPAIIHGLATVDRWLIEQLLTPNRKRELADRVDQLTESRDASVEGSAHELRRIERDLHDGAQQRLVGLAMELGLARERLQRGADPQRALESVTRAHEEAKGTIGDLRNLVRGIHPAVLTDRGLDAALSAVAARSPFAVQIDVVLATRPPAAIEAAAYFVVSEALANVAKHANATLATVRVERRSRSLYVTVSDDGEGGAVVHPGGGLAGLRDRVLAVEGRFRIASPEGGPTTLEAVLPCAS
jgi:signal transduction histidine kinase